MIARVISGGQTGVDQAALRAARAAGLPTGGHAPAGWLTEDGAAPWLAEFGLVQRGSGEYAARTLANVEDANACIWLGNPKTPGGKLTIRLCRERAMPLFIGESGEAISPEFVAHWLIKFAPYPVQLLVAGNRESKCPGIGQWAEGFLAEVFRLAKAKDSP